MFIVTDNLIRFATSLMDPIYSSPSECVLCNMSTLFVLHFTCHIESLTKITDSFLKMELVVFWNLQCYVMEETEGSGESTSLEQMTTTLPHNSLLF